MHNYWTSLETGKPMPVDPELKMNFFNQISLLKSCKPFWSESYVSLDDMVAKKSDV